MKSIHVVRLVPGFLCIAFSIARPATAAAAQDATEPAEQGAVDRRSLELRRVLTLASGGFLRGKTRWVDDRWEHLNKNEWRALPGDLVVDAIEERELLDQAKQRERALGKDQGEKRVEHARWLLESGLQVEGLGQLDRVLEKDPDRCDAREVLGAHATSFRVSSSDPREPAGLADWMRASAGMPPAMREIAIANLGLAVDGDALKSKLASELGAGSHRSREFAALALRRMFPGEELERLLSRAVLDGSDAVRLEAARALRDARDPAVVLPVLRALRSSHATVRNNAIQALGDMGYAGAIEPLISYYAAVAAQSTGAWRPPASNIFVGSQRAYVQDYDVEVAQFAAVADPVVNTLTEGAVLDVRVINAYTMEAAVESRRLRLALEKLTGAKPGNRASDWTAWWREHGAAATEQGPRTGTGS